MIKARSKSDVSFNTQQLQTMSINSQKFPRIRLLGTEDVPVGEQPSPHYVGVGD